MYAEGKNACGIIKIGKDYEGTNTMATNESAENDLETILI